MPTTTELKVISLAEQIKLLIPKEVHDKIRYTCNEISNVEWSGVLFYKVTGSIRDIENISLEAKDIFLMDKGNATYTEYSFDSDVADYIMDRCEADPEFFFYKIGHIHSHQNMGVFFSGTDMGELFDNCINHNFYLSLIVNNRNEMIAKLVYRATPCGYETKDENGESYEIAPFGNEVPLLVSHDCILTKPELKIGVAEGFISRLKAVIEKCKPKVVTTYSGAVRDSDFYKNRDWDKDKKEWIEKPTPAQAAFDKIINTPDPNKNQGLSVVDKDKKQFFNPEDFKNREVDQSEQFACYLIRFGEIFPDDDLQTALEIMNNEGLDGEKLCNHVMPRFGDYYNKFMGKILTPEDLAELAMDDFLDTLADLQDLLADFEGKFSFLPRFISELGELAFITENKWKDAAFGEVVNTEIVN